MRLGQAFILVVCAVASLNGCDLKQPTDTGPGAQCSVACVHGSCVNIGTPFCWCSGNWGGDACDVCMPNYSGPDCETYIDPCWTDPCQNGGSCQSAFAGYVCTCPPGFTGTWCETIIDACEGAPCHNGSTCTSAAGAFTCTCPPGFSGTTCDVDACDTAGCDPVNGTCTRTQGGATCGCVAPATLQPDGHTCVAVCEPACYVGSTCVADGTSTSCTGCTPDDYDGVYAVSVTEESGDCPPFDITSFQMSHGQLIIDLGCPLTSQTWSADRCQTEFVFACSQYGFDMRFTFAFSEVAAGGASLSGDFTMSVAGMCSSHVTATLAR